MAWLLLIIALLSLLTQAQDFLLKYVKPDKRTIWNKRIRWGLFGTSIALVLVTGITNWRKEKQTAIAAKQSDDRFVDVTNKFVLRLSEMTNQFEGKFSAVTNLMAGISRDFQDFKQIVATNPLIDPKLKMGLVEFERRIIAASNDVVDLGLWAKDRDRRRLIEKLRNEENRANASNAWKKIAEPMWPTAKPVFQFTVEQLEIFLRELARQKTQSVVTSFVGIPTVPEYRELGSVKLVDNPTWQFSIRTEIEVGQIVPSLVISSSGATWPYRLLVNKSLVMVVGMGNAAQCSPSDYRGTIKETLQDFLLGIAEKENSK